MFIYRDDRVYPYISCIDNMSKLILKTIRTGHEACTVGPSLPLWKRLDCLVSSHSDEEGG
jgi:hypothetical protein